MKEKKIFTAEIVARDAKKAKELEGILRDEEILFFKESGMFDHVKYKCNLSWVDVKRLIKIGVFDVKRDDINLRIYY